MNPERLSIPVAALVVAIASLALPVRSQTASGPTAVEIQVRAISQVAVHPPREVTASVVARNESKVAAEVAGVVVRWTVETGEDIARGAVLAQIDDTEHRLALERAQAALQAAQARLALAESQLARARELVAQGFLSQDALHARDTDAQLARAELSAAQVQRASAERALRLATVRAPFDAHVKQRLAQAGEYVSAGTPLYVLSERAAGEVVAQVAPGDLASLRSSPEIVFEAAGARHRLAFLRAGGTVSATARTQEVRLKAPHALPAGTEGRLVWREARAHLPATLLVRRGSTLGVFVVDGGRARFVALPEAQEGRAAALPSALSSHAALVVVGQATLQDGQPVTAGAAAGAASKAAR